jgi:transmembrane sensor
MTPATLAPIAPAQFDALKRGDESALADVFKADYDPLERAAEAELHDPAAAARAVEHAFVHAWADLEKVETPEGFNASLLHALHEETARERRRLNAAQRMAQSNGRGPTAHEPVSVDTAWQAVQTALHPKTVDTAAMNAVRHSEAKHHAASTVATLGRKSNGWVMGLAVLVVGALGIASVVLMDRGSESVRITAALANPDATSIKTEPGQMGSLKLADGGDVALGPLSLVKVPPGYNTKWRAVKVEGAAVITVASNLALPFEARVGRVAVVATGTKFAVRQFPEETMAAVRVLEGSVQVRVDDALTPVNAGQTVVIADDVVRPATPDEVARLTGWVDNMVRIETASVEAVLPEMRRWWGLVITVGDADINARPVRFDAPPSDATAAVAGLEKSANVKLVWEKKQMVLRNAAAKR